MRIRAKIILVVLPLIITPLVLIALAVLLLLPGVAPVFAATRPSTTVSAGPVQRADAGYYFGAEIRSDGTLWTWGYNTYGQLGNNTGTNRSGPVAVNTAAGVSALAGKTLAGADVRQRFGVIVVAAIYGVYGIATGAISI